MMVFLVKNSNISLVQLQAFPESQRLSVAAQMAHGAQCSIETLIGVAFVSAVCYSALE